MTLSIAVGGPDNEIVSGGLSYTRKGVYTYTMVYGEQRRIETSLDDSAELVDNAQLAEDWDTTVTWNLALAKTERTKYQDHYRRYSLNPLSSNLKDIDVLRVVSSVNKSPRGFREFEANLTQLSTDNDVLSAYADVKDGATWEQASTKGITVSVDNDANIPAIMFNATADIKDATKDMPKAVTITMVSLGRPYTDNFALGSSAETDYIPFLVMEKNRFRSTVVRKSYRENPSGSATDGTGIDSDSDLTQFGTNISKTFGKIMTGSSVTLFGNVDFNVGDAVTTINIYYNGAYVAKTVDLRVASRTYSFQTDTTSIGFSRP